MLVICADCKRPYDDAVRWTFCPHERFLTQLQAEQKDLAITLLGKRVRFLHEPQGESYRVTRVGMDGLVSLEGLIGYFSPRLFVLAG